MSAEVGEWTQQRIRWLFVAASDLQCTRASPVALYKNGRFSEEGESLMLAIGRASSLAFEAENQWVLQRPRRASAMSDEALALFNTVAKAVGAPLRQIDSPAPVEPDELRSAREERARKAREREVQQKRTWSPEKIRILGDMITRLPKSVPSHVVDKVWDLHRTASNAAYFSGNFISGPKYERMATAAEECLAAFNRLLPAGDRKTVEDL